MSVAEGFSADWLDLREPADARARARTLTESVAERLPRDAVVHALDLASGTGSNVRYVSDCIRSPQRWLLVDHSAALLEIASQRLGASAATHVLDLTDLDRLATLMIGRDLVTASALLDLVSASWLERVLALVREAGAPVLFALSYDGRLSCSPEDPDDTLVRTLVNRHQRTDKGFGEALGPDAAPYARRALERLGYRVLCEQSDWRVGADEAELQGQLIDGWAQAASEIESSGAQRIAAWRERRLQHLAAGRSSLTVGHQDIAGLL
jgi:hypothetical protein